MLTRKRQRDTQNEQSAMDAFAVNEQRQRLHATDASRFAHLYADALQTIFSHLSLDARLKACRVSRHWRAVAPTGQPIGTTQSQLTVVTKGGLARLAMSPTIRAHLAGLNAIGLVGEQTSTVFGLAEMVAIGTCRRLRRLEIHIGTFRPEWRAFALPPLLDTLRLRVVDWSVPSFVTTAHLTALVLQALVGCQRMEKLSLCETRLYTERSQIIVTEPFRGVDFSPLLKLPRLQQLELNEPMRNISFGRSNVFEVVQKLAALVVLPILGSSELTIRRLLTPPHNLASVTTLRGLELPNDVDFHRDRENEDDASAIRQISAQLPNLTLLDVFSYLPGDAWVDLIGLLPPVTHFTCANRSFLNQPLGDVQFRSLRVERLEYLRLDRFSWSHGKETLAFLHTLVSLCHLSLAVTLSANAHDVFVDLSQLMLPRLVRFDLGVSSYRPHTQLSCWPLAHRPSSVRMPNLCIDIAITLYKHAAF